MKYEMTKEEYSLNYNSVLIIENEFMDIYEENDLKNTLIRRYFLTIPNSKELIGILYLNYNDYIPMFGNIGYYCYSDYRHKKIISKALELLLPIFYKRGLKKGVICTRPDNVASIKIALNFGCEAINLSNDPMGINRYEIDISKKIKESGGKVL